MLTITDVMEDIRKQQRRRRLDGETWDWNSAALDSQLVGEYARQWLGQDRPRDDDDAEYYAKCDQVIHSAHIRYHAQRIVGALVDLDD